jgi:hypothetical protein
MPAYETAEKIYLTPFHKQNVEAAIQKTVQPPEGRIILGLSKEGSPNPMTVPNNDLNIFINADFDTLWNQLTSPAPQININSKDLQNYLKQDRESRETSHQYG